ncbi:MAG: hypothetical protein QOJ99_1358 [Bryobacterales bacterium]|nr:hypothetical protein [Bryobacterales bacterium]
MNFVARGFSVIPPWVRMGLLLLFTAAYLFPLTSLLYRVGDDGTLIYGAQRVTEGAIPGRDFLEVMGPGSFYWLAMFFRLFGTGWQVTRVVLLLTGVATIGLLYAIARQACRESVALLLWLFVLVVGMRIWPAVSHHWDSNLFAVAALRCYLKLEKTARRRWAITAGALAGITSCFIQHKGLLLVIGLMAGSVIRRVLPRSSPLQIQGKWTATWLIAGSYTAVGVAVLTAYWKAGALGDLFYANVTWPMFGYQTVNVVPYGQLLLSIAAGPAFKVIGPDWATTSLVCAGFSLVPFLVIAILPLLVAGAALACLWDPEKRRIWLAGPLLVLTLAGTALWLSEIHRKDVIHLIYGSPVLLIALLATLAIILDSSLRKVVMGTLAMGLIVFGTLHFISEGRGSQTVETRLGPVRNISNDEALRYLCTAVAKREFVFVYPYSPIYYYLADVGNPTRFSILLYGYNTPDQFDEVIRNLEEKRVRYILWDTKLYGEKLRALSPAYRHPSGDNLKLERYFSSKYDDVAMKGDFRILQRRQSEDREFTVHSGSF